MILPCPETVLIPYNRNTLDCHVFNADKCSSLNGEYHLIDALLFSLDLHGDRAVPFILYPSCTAVQIGRMPRSVPKSDTLYRTIEYYMFSDHLTNPLLHESP